MDSARTYLTPLFLDDFRALAYQLSVVEEMKITLFTLCLFLLGTLPELRAQDTKDAELSKQWVDGYLYDFNQWSRDLLGKTPLTVEIFDYSQEKRKSQRIEIDDSELSRRLVEMILASVKEAAEEQNYVDESGNHHGRRVSVSSARDSMELTWEFDGFTLGYRLNANGVSLHSEIKTKRKTILVDSVTKPAKLTLSEEIKKTLQPGSSYNSGQSLRD